MIEDRENHLTSDEAVLERFVLGRMTAAERTSAESHVATCASCAAAVQRERLLAAGIRRLGRDRLKSSLAKRVAGTDSTNAPWAKILSAAAVVAIIVGVGIANDWFKENKEVLGGYADTPALTDETGAKEVQKFDAAPRQAAAQPQKEIPAPRNDRHPPDLQTQRSFAGKDAEKGAPAAPASGSGARNEISAPSPTSTRAEGGDQTFWTEGVSLGQAEEPRETDALKKSLDEPSSRREPSKSKISRDDANPASLGGLQGPTHDYKINQRPVSALPREQRMKQQSRGQNRVQTKIEQRAGTTEMTLYLDSLIDAGDVRRANVETVAGDSVVVNMGNQRIGYKLPTGLNTQEQHRAK